MTYIPFDPEFDAPPDAPQSPILNPRNQSSEKFLSRFAFIFGVMIAFAGGMVLANVILFKLIFNK